MGKGAARPSDKKVGKLTDCDTVDVVLKEMQKAVPEIERRVLEREAIAMELRFEAPRVSDVIKRKDKS
ncbi:MAG: hypothetical protein OXC12_18700 [Spirochaetaceae bacterium]|nr:hypothetical protein [Spirochaetaceae bacterium]